MSVSSGMIRLPKATKTPLKSKLVPRQSLATIVKDLGKNTSCDITSPTGLWILNCHTVCALSVLPLVWLVVVSLQPPQLLWNSRHLEDPRHPSTGIRPASLEWAKACWEREASTASVVHTHTNTHIYLMFMLSWTDQSTCLKCSTQNVLLRFRRCVYQLLCHLLIPWDVYLAWMVSTFLNRYQHISRLNGDDGGRLAVKLNNVINELCVGCSSSHWAGLC